VLVALGMVALLMSGIVGIDLFLAKRVADQTGGLIGNAQRSAELLDHMRGHVRYLLSSPHDRREMNRITREIAADAREYDPLASYPGERAEWKKLEGLLDALPRIAADAPRIRDELVEEINASVDELIAINHREARGIAGKIREAHLHALWSDTVVGAGTFTLMLVVVIVLLRVLGRQRRLVAERVRWLDEKNSELEAFAARAAHDLRSPLNPVRGYAELILEAEGLPEGVASMAMHIRRGVDRMTGVIDGMLALSVSGRPPVGECVPAVVIAGVLEEMGAELHGVMVETRLQAGTDRVACEQGVLGQILRNLIGNALKFRSPDRALIITIETHEAGAAVEIAVEDNGLGMDRQSVEHAFEPFYRGPTVRVVPGHGLGLAIVERTIRSLGGSSRLSSEPGRGTRVSICIPRVLSPDVLRDRLDLRQSA
jgi:signal transduction histidine kinase